MKIANRAVRWGAGLVIGAGVLGGLSGDAAADAVWSGLPPMPEARAYAGVAAVGADGVLVVGGADENGNPLGTAIVFDATSGTWNVQAVEAGQRMWPSVVPRPDGRVLVVGGYTEDGSVPQVVHYTAGQGIYPPEGNGPAHGAMVWSEIAGGKIVFVGGYDTIGFSADTDVYAPVSKKWYAGTPMSAPRAFAGAVRLPDGRVMVAGGCAQSLDLPVADATTEIYDPDADLWIPGPPMATARWGFASASLPSGKWMVAGGVTTVNGEMVATGEVEIFDPVTMEWTAGPALGTARGLASFGTLSDGSLLVAGGETGPLLSNTVLASAERFDEAAGAWASAGTMGSPRYWTAGARLSTGKLVVPGGAPSQAQGVVASVDLYIPNAVPCATVADCPAAANDCTTMTCDTDHGLCKAVPKGEGLPCFGMVDWCNSLTQCHFGECVLVEYNPCGTLDECHGEGACSSLTGMCEWPALGDDTQCEGGAGICDNGECLLLDQGGSGGGGSGGSGGGGSGGNPAVGGGPSCACVVGSRDGGAASWLGALGALAAVTGLSMRRRGRKNTRS